MFKKIRNTKRQLPEESAIRILQEGEYGILATISENGYPYTTPLNYVFSNNAIYFHCALTGHKLENIQKNNKVSFCIVQNMRILASVFSTAYESVVIFGEASPVRNAAEKKNALEGLIDKYTPEYKESGLSYIKSDQHKTEVIKIEIHHITAKGRKD